LGTGHYAGEKLQTIADSPLEEKKGKEESEIARHFSHPLLRQRPVNREEKKGDWVKGPRENSAQFLGEIRPCMAGRNKALSMCTAKSQVKSKRRVWGANSTAIE